MRYLPFYRSRPSVSTQRAYNLPCVVSVDSADSAFPVRAIQVEFAPMGASRKMSAAVKAPGRHLSLESFGRMLECFPHLERLELWGTGGVPLDPCLLAMIHMAKAHGVHVQLHSPEGPLDLGEALALVKTGLDAFCVHWDSAEEDLSVEKLMAARNLLSSHSPSIAAEVAIGPGNGQRIPHYLALAEDLGLESILFRLDHSPGRAGEVWPADRAWIRPLPAQAGQLRVIWAFAPESSSELSGKADSN